MYNYEVDGEKGKKGPPPLDVMLLQHVGKVDLFFFD